MNVNNKIKRLNIWKDKNNKRNIKKWKKWIYIRININSKSKLNN